MLKPTCALLALLVSVTALVAGPAPAPPDLLTTHEIGLLETHGAVTGRDGGYSARVGGVSVWVYGDTALSTPGVDGGTWRNNTMSWTHDLHPVDGLSGFADWADTAGVPREFLPYTAEEIDYNNRHRGDNCLEPPCNVKYGMWPAAIIPDPARGRVLFTYAKMWLGTGAWNFYTMGRGIAVGPPLGPVERPLVRPGAIEPTLLFDQNEPGFVNAAFVQDVDGVPHAYLYDCTGDGFAKPMRLARVPLAEILDRSAWRFFAGNDVWSPNVADAAIVFDGADQLSVHWNSFLSRYLAIYIDPLSTHAVARVADHPEGPWSDETPLFDALPPVEGGLVYCGMAHLELQRDGGRIETVSYVRDTGPFLSERRLVEIEFANRIDADVRDADYDTQHGVMLSDASARNQLCMGSDGLTWRQMALQFRLSVPTRSTITEASLELVSSGRNAGGYTSTVRAIAQDDVAPFVAGTQPSFTSAYPLTQASYDWTPANLPAGARLSTGSLTSLFQEVVSRPGWQAGHYLGLVFPETRVGQNLRCFQDSVSGAATAATLRLGYYQNGTAVCLDARGGEDALRVTREPPAGCDVGGSGPAREFVFGRLGALRAIGGVIDLGPVHCADAYGPSTRQVVRAADPDQVWGDASFYLTRSAGAASFGVAHLADGSTPARMPVVQSCP